MRVSGQMFGRWSQTNRLFAMFSFRLRKQIEGTLQECAEMYYREIQSCVATGGYGTWPPLTEAWVRRKGHSNFYEYTNAFLQGIRVEFVERGPVNYRMFVGVRGDEMHPRGISMQSLSDVLEIGYGRPLFDLAWNRVEPVIDRKLREIGGGIFR